MTATALPFPYLDEVVAENEVNLPVERPLCLETTSLGIGFLAGLGIDYWKEGEISHLWKREATFLPRIQKEKREELYTGWKRAVARILSSNS